MAQHKAPTQVTLVPHEEKSALAEFVERHWTKAALLAAVISAAILWNVYSNKKEAAAIDESWDSLMAAVEEDRLGGFVGDVNALGALAVELQDTVAGPWALFLQAQNLRADGNYDESIAVLTELRQKYPEHSLVTRKFVFGDSVTPLSMTEHLSKVYDSEKRWKEEHPLLYANPEPPADAPRVRIKTDKGDIVVALYSDRAPRHVENFLKLAGESFYDGTKFHTVRDGFVIEGGDPASREDKVDDWGKVGADYTIEKEDTGLSNFEGFIGAGIKMSETESNGSLFYITLTPIHYMNYRNTVFGKVVEGLDVAKEISGATPVQGTARPEEPTVLVSTEVLPAS